MKYSGVKKALYALALVMPLLLSNRVWAGGVVIVNPNNTNQIAEIDIQRFFLGKINQYADNSPAIAVDQKDSSPIRPVFINKVLNKDEQQYKAYWAQRLFTGKGKPPKQVGDSADVKALVAKNPALIGYIDAQMVDSSVRVVLSFE